MKTKSEIVKREYSVIRRNPAFCIWYPIHLVIFIIFILHPSSFVLSSPPNILFIFIDDMGFADPSCFGNPLMETPHIDRLAAEGIKLTNFYVNSPICSASRVALTTGQYQGRWNIHSFLNTRAGNANRGMADFLDPAAPTTAKKLKAVGYATAHFGKWHMGGGRDVDDAPHPQAYGFDESLVSFEGLGDRIISNPNGVERARTIGQGEIIPCSRWERIQIQTDRAIDFIKRHKDQPFYVRLFPNDVHDKHEPMPGTAEKYASVSNHPPEQDFLAVLEELDRQIGRIVGEIDKLGLGEKTLIVFTSDNGPTDWPKKHLDGGYPAGFTGPYHGRKWSLFEGGVRMPFIARWKGTIPAGIEDSKSVVSAIDMSPTMCKFVGVPVEAELDGLDRSDVLLGKPSVRAKPVFWQYGHPHALLKGGKAEHQSPTFSMRDGPWKFLANPDGSEAQLYDLEADESEKHNLLRGQPEHAAAMSAQIAEWAHELGFDYDAQARLAEPGPTMAVWAGNQLLRFENHGVKGDENSLRFNGKSWLDLPAFRAPNIAYGRNLQVNGIVHSDSDKGVIFAHGDRENGFSIYLKKRRPVLAVCVEGERKIIEGDESLAKGDALELKWNSNGEVFFKINKKLVGRTQTVIIQEEPSDTIQVGADMGKAIGDYETPNLFKGTLEKLSFKYPNGS